MKSLPFYNPELSYADVVNILTTFGAKEKLHAALAARLGVSSVILLKSARQGIDAILKTIEVGKGDEVIVPAFICAVVPEAVLRAGAMPVFCDIEADNIALSHASFVRQITPRTKAVIIPHYFGIPTALDPFIQICKDRDITIIEDCAHAFGATYKGKAVGTIGDFSVFSFGMSKSFRGVGGGFAVAKDQAHQVRLAAVLEGRPPLSFTHRIREYLEVLAAPFIFSRFGYPLTRRVIEQYAPMHRVATSDVQYDQSMSRLEAATALLQLSRFEEGSKKRMANMSLFGSHFRLSPSPPAGVPVGAYAFAYAEPGTYEQLREAGLPVRYADFGNLHLLSEFEKCRFENVNEQSLQGRYLLLPLWMNSGQMEHMVAEAKHILE